MRRPFVRRLDAEGHFEIFLAAAVAAVLLIRFCLKLANYPQLSTGSFHIAHVLWGGLLMMAAIVMQLSFLNRDIIRLTALVGGVGFGTFIDEVGKFITKDNDYFVKPSVALMYVIFVLLSIIGARVFRRTASPDELLLNAIQELEELALHDLDERERGRVEELLARSDPQNPLVHQLQALVHGAPVVPRRSPGLYARARQALRDVYARLSRDRRFRSALVAVFVGQFAFKSISIVVLVFFAWTLPSPFAGRSRHAVLRLADLTAVDWAQLVTTAISGLFVFAGVVGLASSRRFAYRMFRNSLLVSIALTQVFVFYEEQFAGIVGLALNLLLLFALQAATEFERLDGASAAT